MDFKDLITLEKQEVVSTTEEARFSFIKGVYVEDNCPQGTYAIGSIHLSPSLSICHCLNKFCPIIVLWLSHSFAFLLFFSIFY